MKNTRELTLNAMFMTIIIIMALVPSLGIFQVGAIAIQVLHIPVIIAGLVLGFKSGVLNGFVFGVVSLYVALTRGSGPLDPYFINPIVSVLPRILFGISIGSISGLLGGFIKNDTIKFGGAAFLSTLAHTFFVFVALSSVIFVTGIPSFGDTSSTSGFFIFLAGIFAYNAVLEAIAAMLIVPPVVLALKRLRGNRY